MLSIEARKKMLDLSRERVGMREEINTRGAGSRALIIEAELQYENFKTTDASERGQLVETEAGIVSLEKRLQQAQDQFIAEQAQKGAEAERKRDRLEQELIKARSKRERTRLRAPSAGIVQQLEVSTLGQVVASGQPLVSVVPVDAPLEVEAMIANRDIGFVRPGQRATVKIDAFAFTRYGTIDAEVVRVSTDAIDDRNATAMMDAASAVRPQVSAAPKPPSGQSLVFPAVLKLGRSTIDVEGKEIPLSPGMTVTVEIKTGERRAISYVLSPLGEIISTSARER
jgi:hemolysin D